MGHRVVRIRLGAGWKEDPELRDALARGRARRVPLVDAVAIEVDGVDIAAGRTEGELLAALEELVGAAARLVGGAHRAAVHFPESGLELLLRRSAGGALLTLVSIERPSRLLAEAVEVELPALARAAREAAEALLVELAALGGGARAWGAGLDRALASLAAARPLRPGETRRPAPAPAPAPRRRAGASCGFELRDDDGLLASYDGGGADLGSLLAPGRVWVRAASGEELLAVDGAPFLLLRDLAALGERIAAAHRERSPRAEAELALPGRARALRIDVDLGAGTAAAGGDALAAEPLALARALLEAALDFCGAACARNPRQARNPWISDLREAAREGLRHVRELDAGDRPAAPGAPIRARRARAARAPLAPGRMKRLAFRRSWECEVGAPAGFGLSRGGDRILAAGAAAVAAVDAVTGATLWRAAGAAWAGRAGGALLALRGGDLACHDAATGRTRWSRPLAGPPRGLAAIREGPLVLATGGALLALDPWTGRAVWRLEPPAATALHLAGFGPLALAAGDAGFLYGVDAGGRVAWRLRLAGVPVGPPQPLGGSGIVACATELGGALLRFDAATGRRQWAALLDFTPSGAAVPFAGRVGAPGAIGGDPLVAAVELDGAVAWTEGAPIAGPLAAAALSASLLVKNAAGACAALGRDGEALWTHARETPDPPPANVPPVCARGVALVAGEQVLALDPASGALLGAARVGAPVRLQVGEDLSLVAMDAAGVVTAARLATHLSVL
jgi:hypothetical protein